MTDPDGVMPPRPRWPDHEPALRSPAGTPYASTPAASTSHAGTPQAGTPQAGTPPYPLTAGTPNGSSPPTGPMSASEYARTGTRGYVDVAEANAPSLGEVGYWAALALAAGADIAAFHQVISLVMRRQQDLLIWVMVVGFTAAALTLAHFGGRLWRDVTAERAPATKKQVATCLVPWALLGLVAFAIRLIIDDPTGGSFADVTVGDETVGAIVGADRRLASALMFLGLYTASGAVAGFGAYLTRNPLRVGYRRALRAHHRSLRSLSRSQPPYERAVRVMALQEASLRREQQSWQAAREWRLAHADQMKRYAAMLIASKLKDPSVTDGMTLPDRRPMPPPPPPPQPDPPPGR